MAWQRTGIIATKYQAWALAPLKHKHRHGIAYVARYLSSASRIKHSGI